MRLAKEWVSGSVGSSAPDITKQPGVLRKKVFEHGSTKAPIMPSNIVDKAEEDRLTNVIINNEAHHVQTTTRIFHTAYKEAK